MSAHARAAGGFTHFAAFIGTYARSERWRMVLLAMQRDMDLLSRGRQGIRATDKVKKAAA